MNGYLKIKTDETTVKNFTRGDIKAFDLLYSNFCSRLHSFIFSLVKTESDSEEIVQDVF